MKTTTTAVVAQQATPARPNARRPATAAIAVVVSVTLMFTVVTPPAGASVLVADLPYGPAVHQRLDLHLPGGPGPHPVIVYAHGGGWVGGDKVVVSEPIRAMVTGGTRLRVSAT